MSLKNYLLFGTFITLTACGSKKEASEKIPVATNYIELSNEQVKQIQTDTVKLVNEESELNLTGKISFDEDKVSKVYPLVGGNVIKVNVSLGDYVERGQVLAVIKSGDISDLQSQYNVALSNMQIAQKNMDIAEELFKTNVNSEKDLLNARNDFKKSMAEVNKLKQLLRIYGASETNDDAEYRVIAPTDGYIVEKNITENMSIRSDNTSNIFTVSFLKTVWVMADVYESDLSKIKIDEEVDVITIAYPDRTFKGTIRQVSSLLDPNSKSLKVRIVLDNSEGLLKPEMFASVKVHIKHPNKVLAIPTNSLVFENNRFHVLVKEDGNKFIKKPVEVLNSLKDKTFLKNGLNEGEIVVSKGSLLVSNKEVKKS